MNNSIVFLCLMCMLCAGIGNAQITEQVTAIQYFFDSDPGVGMAGNGGIIDVMDTEDFEDQIELSLPSLSLGVHQLYIRARDEYGRWSIAERRSFYVSDVEEGLANIVAYQYYFDSDPGVGVPGNGAIVQITSTGDYNQTVFISIPALSNGVHQLYIRAKDENGRWSIVERRTFYVSDILDGVANVVAYQYFFDTDPGVGLPGNGAIVPVSSTGDYNQTVSITIPELNEGVHQLLIRTQDANGRWSIAERRSFYVSAALSEDVTALEYYFDSDPGVGNAYPYPISATDDFNATIDLGVPCLFIGTHYLYVRAKDSDDRWSIIERDTFEIIAGIEPPVVDPAGPIMICEGEMVMLSTEDIPGVTYQWEESGNAIDGETETSLIVTESGSYTVRATCGMDDAVSNVVVVVVEPLGTYYADTDEDGYGDPENSVVDCPQPDGYVSNDGDCDDTNMGVNPGAPEVCNMIDDDCDDLIDEGVENTYYADSDDDGYGDAEVSVMACTAPDGYVDNDDDCDDTDEDVHPGATEECNLIDDDCDGVTDDGVESTFYADVDGDGFGDTDETVLACEAPDGYVANDEDCDDGDPDINPDAPEVCNDIDDDCDDLIDEADPDLTNGTTWYLDGDDDGYGDPDISQLDCDQPEGYVNNDDDCDDSDPDINPDAPEVCNDIDDDCDGLLDDDDPDIADASTWYADSDDDGYGNLENTTLACERPDGYVGNDDDCDDDDPDINPGADEVCNELDDDCDGLIDDEDSDVIDQPFWYIDDDNDGYGDPGMIVQSCEQPNGYVSNDSDCDDADPLVNPDATELCNEIDDDCDGLTDDEDSDLAYPYTWYIDDDGDGYGDPGTSQEGCEQPEGYVGNDDDCDDSDPDLNPGEDEVCNNMDDDCDGLIDDDDPDVTDQTTWYADDDNDGYGDPVDEIVSCDQPVGYVSNDGDDCPMDPDKQAPGICGCGNPEPGTACDDGDPETINDVIDENCECHGESAPGCFDGVRNGDEIGIDCGGSCPPCSPPDAVCGVITVYVNPADPDYDGPGSQNIWLIPAEDLDAGSTSDDTDPLLTVRRHLTQITFDWTTSGACIDVTLNGTVTNPDKGTVYRTCLPVRNADFNIWRLYQLRIQDPFGEDACYGTVKVIPLVPGFASAPSVHYVIPYQEEHEMEMQIPDRDAPSHPAISNDIHSADMYVYPNPGTQIMQMRWNAFKEEQVTILITDIAGHPVLLNQYQTTQGKNLVAFDMSDLPGGVYLVQLQSNTMQETQRWLKISK